MTMYVLAAAVVTGGAMIYSSKQSGKAAKQAAATQAQSAEEANTLQWDMYQQSRQDQLPWLEAGGRALGTLEERVAAGPGKFEESPGYQFTKAEGERAINRGLAPRGLYGSGKALKELTRFGTGLASQEYDKFLGRHYQSLTPLQSLAGVGQTTGRQLGAEGANIGSAMGGNLMAAGQARAQGLVNQATAQAQGLQGVGQAIGGAIQNWPTSTDAGTIAGAGGGGYSTPTQVIPSTVAAPTYNYDQPAGPPPNAWWSGYEWVY
jgi:hypothetical protein